MDFKYQQLEQELSALSKVFSELGIRLSEVAKEVTAAGVNPSEKLIEQISASRASFESVRSAVHGHATAMLVSPLPKLGELVSIATIESLFKASAVAEENKFSIEAERDKALAILGRVLSIIHRETGDFKPLQEFHAKVAELLNAVSNTVWPHRHPESDSIILSKHPATDFLYFVENLDQLDDERWMALETTITDSYGKLLFVAASRGKLAVTADTKPDAQPAATKPTGAAPEPAKPAPAPEAAKPAVAAETPVERKIVAEKAPEKPAPVPAAPAPSVAPAAQPAVSVEKKPAPSPVAAPATPAPAAQKPAGPPAPAPSTNSAPAVPIQATPVVTPEKKPVQTVPAPAPAQAHPAPAASTPVAPQAAVSAPPAPPAPTPSLSPTPVAAPAAAPSVALPRPPAPAPPAPAVAATPQPAPSVSTQVPVAPAATASVTINSLSALATATEPAEKKPASAPAEALDKQRKEPRLATPAPQSVSKPEPKPQEVSETMQPETIQQGMGGDGSQRPQRWGFWRGNR